MKVIYTKHSLAKFNDLAELGIHITKTKINSIVIDPISIDTTTDYPKKIAEGELDSEHILRIVYREESDIIIIITFYPTRKGRYL